MAAGSLNVWIRNADGSLLQLTTSAAPTWISMVPAWTADGQRIVFESNREVPPADSTSNDPYDVSGGVSISQAAVAEKQELHATTIPCSASSRIAVLQRSCRMCNQGVCCSQYG